MIIQAIATVGFVGHIRPAPGTWGSLAAVPLAWVIYVLGGWPLLLMLTVAFAALGWWATAAYIANSDNHDPSEVVVDELVGQWIALLPVAIGASHSGAGFWALWPGVLTAFLAFRAFDIFKPGPVGWADRRGDALGVMLDDIVAGILAAFVVLLGAYIAHG